MIQEPNISLLVYVAADLKLCSSKKGVSPGDGDGDGDGGSPRVTVVVAVIVIGVWSGKPLVLALAYKVGGGGEE